VFHHIFFLEELGHSRAQLSKLLISC